MTHDESSLHAYLSESPKIHLKCVHLPQLDKMDDAQLHFVLVCYLAQTLSSITSNVPIKPRIDLVLTFYDAQSRICPEICLGGVVVVFACPEGSSFFLSFFDVF